MSNQFSALAGTASFTALRSVGGALPPDLIASVVAGGVPGLSGTEYHLELGLSPREAANRAWTVLTGAWTTYREALASLPPGQATTGLTRERWSLVLMRELGFGRVPTTPAGGLTVDGRSFPVSHLAGGNLPVHLLGWGTDLDRRTPGMAGAADQAPQAMVQRLLNSSDAYLWALVSNGSTLRVLRDSTSLVGPSYVEFDVAAIFDDDLFSDFVALYLICHESRFEATDPAAGVASCWLERWRDHAVETGARALGALRVGVHNAIEALGTGFVAHQNNSALRDDLVSGKLLPADFLHGLLRLVYRALFCFVAEDRGLLLDPEAPAEARTRYHRWFSTARLRQIATRRAGDNHSDHWQSLRLVLGSLGKEEGCPTLGIVGLGGIFEPGPVDLDPGLEISNRHLLTATRYLCVTRPDANGPRRMVDYRNLGAEELGGIYEGLLDYTPKYDRVTRSFSLVSLAGSERKTTGSYYTPSSLVEKLLDTALDPLLDEAERKPDPEAVLLSLKVCDPACGSAHFLTAAARRVARRVAGIRAQGAEPTVEQIHDAMYDVISHCLFGVDVNPLAAELAKVSLWLEGMAAGRPLSLLDGHIKIGNSLLGTTPALLYDGIPDGAFTPMEGDDKKTAAILKKRNQAERAGARQIGEEAQVPFLPVDFATVAAQVEAYVPKSLADAHIAAKRLRELDSSHEARRARLVADAWCSAFVFPKVANGPTLTQSELRAIAAGKGSPDAVKMVEAVSAQYRWFHWHLEFPTVFAVGGSYAEPATGSAPGFDCVIGNPPWDQIQLNPQEFFAPRYPAIAEEPNTAARDKAIRRLQDEHPTLYVEYTQAKRQVDGFKHFIHQSGRYPFTAFGRLNSYSLFAEHFRAILHPVGRAGVILPTGIATDSFNQYFFKDVVTSRSLVALYDFENRDKLFETVDSRVKFCLLTLAGIEAPVKAADFAFFAHETADLDRPGARFILTPEELLLLNPNTGTCPIFRGRRDAEITLAVYRRHPVLLKKGDATDSPWGVSFQLMFMMNTDSHLFHTRAELETDGWKLNGNTFHRSGQAMLPLYEGKMVHHYDHRWATYEDDGTIRDVAPTEHDSPVFSVLPRYWVEEKEVSSRLNGRWERGWLLGFRDICRSTDERTLISGSIPLVAVGNKFPLLLAPNLTHILGACLSSMPCDYIARQKLGGTSMNFFYVEQLPVPSPDLFHQRSPWGVGQRLQAWVEDRLVELTYTAWDIAPTALDVGDDGAPFRWDTERRSVIRAELDAAFFHLYGIDRDDVDYILDTFPIVRKHDEEHCGEYRTKRLVLEAYDALAKAIETVEPFVSALTPPPGKGQRHPAQATTPVWKGDRGPVRVELSSHATGCGHNPDLGGGTPECQVCAFNTRRSN